MCQSLLSGKIRFCINELPPRSAKPVMEELEKIYGGAFKMHTSPMLWNANIHFDVLTSMAMASKTDIQSAKSIKDALQAMRIKHKQNKISSQQVKS